MQRPENVAIFWDFESLPPDPNQSGYELIENIRSLAHAFGSVISLKAYLDTSALTSPSLRAELHASGVSLIDCPHNGKKDMADKMLIADMVAFAIDHPSPSTIFLISSDRDYAYAVSTLRLRRYQVVILCPSSAHKNLLAQASVHLDWNTEVLGETTPPRPPPALNPLQAPPTLSRQRAKSNVSRPLTPSVARAILDEDDDYGDDFLYGPRYDTNHNSIPSSTRVNGILDDNGSRHAAPSDATWRQTPSRTPSKPFSPPASFRSAISSSPTPPPLERKPSEPVFVTNGNLIFESSSKPSLPEGFPFLDPEPATAPKAQQSIPTLKEAPQPAPIHVPHSISFAPFVPASPAALSPVRAPAVPTPPVRASTPPPPAQTLAEKADLKPDFGPTLTPAPSSIKLPAAAAQAESTPTPPKPAAEGFVAFSASPQAPNTTLVNGAGPSKPAPKLAPKPVAAHFRPLIQVLEARTPSRGRRVPRTDVGSDLAKHKNVYTQAGVTKFSSYMILAVDAGIVDVGGSVNDQWVALRPEWSSSTMFPMSK
ncbi:hypothetical protein D9615_001821 [Tricholomella constricta]|uniref:NYN domain-containing protein n=1 Tax=Tricholomella constricta TaxID=117010 RepID=A0A8H5MB03_9AGAR|nr:hypothetical protein D9615_001821 [Tricholomella constricta]